MTLDMKEPSEPHYLRPELLDSEAERAETPANKVERAIGSTSELVLQSATTLERAGKNIDGLREGPTRDRLDKRQEILARRLSGFRKKVGATLAGLAFAVGIGRMSLEASREPSEQISTTDTPSAKRDDVEEADPSPIETDSEMEEDTEVNEPLVPSKADPFAVPAEKRVDAFDAEIAEEAAEAAENLKFEEEAKQEELSAMRDYADLVIDDLMATDPDKYASSELAVLQEIFREKAKDIGVDEEEFVRQATEANLTRYGSVMKKVLEAPGTITPEERPIAEAVRRQLRESETEDKNATEPTDDTQG